MRLVAVLVPCLVVLVPVAAGQSDRALGISAAHLRLEAPDGGAVLAIAPGSRGVATVDHVVIVPPMTLCWEPIRVAFVVDSRSDLTVVLLTSAVTSRIDDRPGPSVVASDGRVLSSGWEARISIAAPAEAVSGPRLLRLGAQAAPLNGTSARCNVEPSTSRGTTFTVVIASPGEDLVHARAMAIVTGPAPPEVWVAHETSAASVAGSFAALLLALARRR